MTVCTYRHAAWRSLLVATVAVIALSGTSASAAGQGDELKRHVPGVFIGATRGAGETDISVGLEYEFRATKWIGFGAVAEWAPGAHHGDGTSLYLGAIHVHPIGGLRLTAGYGVEDVHDEKKKRAAGLSPSKNEDVFRLGAAYDFHAGDFGIAPTVNLDFIDHKKVVVFGISVTRPF